MTNLSPSAMEQSLLTALENHPDLVALYRVQGEDLLTLGFNRALREQHARLLPNIPVEVVSGSRREDLLGRALENAEYLKESHGWVQSAITGKQCISSKITNPLLPEQVLHVKVVPVLSADDSTVTHLYWMAQDIRPVLEKEQLLLRQQGELEREVEQRTHALRTALLKAEAATQVKGDFLARISHELRTPMHAIISFAALGKDPQMSPPIEKMQGYFENIYRAAGQMVEMLSDLLDFSKLESRRMSFEYRRNRLRDITLDTLESLRELAEKRSQTLVLRCPEDLMAQVDGMRVGQVLRNLISNAIKYSHPKTEIEVEWVAGPPICLRVLDRGPGIPPGEEESIFEMFTQSSNTRTQNRGTGLGLAISREIAKAHGGTLVAMPRDGGGSRFELTLGEPPVKGA